MVVYKIAVYLMSVHFTFVLESWYWRHWLQYQLAMALNAERLILSHLAAYFENKKLDLVLLVIDLLCDLPE